jgi:hypothetical protein
MKTAEEPYARADREAGLQRPGSIRSFRHGRC